MSLKVASQLYDKFIGVFNASGVSSFHMKCKLVEIILLATIIIMEDNVNSDSSE